MHLSTLVLLSACSFFSANALAQWQWVDAQGRKVFSDRPPPAQVPAGRILQSPQSGTLPAASPAPTAASPLPAAQAADRVFGVDEELQSRKAAKEAEQALQEQTKREALQKKQARVRQDNCARAKTALASLAEGRRVAHTNVQGERIFIDASTRNAERQRIQAIIASDCTPSGSPLPR